MCVRMCSLCVCVADMWTVCGGYLTLTCFVFGSHPSHGSHFHTQVCPRDSSPQMHRSAAPSLLDSPADREQ